jgi:hypothetical protein
MKQKMTMQPVDFKLSHLPFRVTLAQPKLEGVHAILNSPDRFFQSRKGTVLLSVDHILSELESCGLSHLPLDGEMWVPNKDFDDINGLVMSKNPRNETATIEFHVFDIALPGLTTIERQTILDSLKETAHIKRIETQHVSSLTHAKTLYRKYLKAGHEGMILRNGKGNYVFGESKNRLLKVKPDERRRQPSCRMPKPQFIWKNNSWVSLATC